MTSLDIATRFMIGIFGLAGVLAIMASVFNKDWFFNSVNARAVTGRMSRRMARVFYFIAGVAIVVMAVYMAYES